MLDTQGDRIEVVNSSAAELAQLSALVRAETVVVREGWVKDMIYSYKVGRAGRAGLVRLLGGALLLLLQAGWTPVTPVTSLERRQRAQPIGADTNTMRDLPRISPITLI